MHENIDRILFTEDEIKQRVAEIGAGITQDYKDDPDGVILISVLRGAAIFMADLARQIQLPCGDGLHGRFVLRQRREKAPAWSAF